MWYDFPIPSFKYPTFSKVSKSNIEIWLIFNGPLVVSVETNVKHPIYSKIVKRTYNLKAHDEENACQIGDKVKVMETRPLSRDKRFRVVEILEKAVIK